MYSAIITGVTGQDGSYMLELLLSKGYKVYGITRRSSTDTSERIKGVLHHPNFELIFGDITSGIDTLIYEIKPDLLINLAAMSHVRVSFDVPVYTMDTNTVAVARMLEAIRKSGYKNNIRFYQASSSEMFGLTPAPQSEASVFMPCSPYGVAKVASYWLVRTYRAGYNMFASNGILFNHESPRRGEFFVTKKIVRTAVRIKLGLENELILGNLEARRDWGHSKDYMKAIYKIMTHSVPDDFVVATGEYYSVKDFLEKVFLYLDMRWEDYVRFDSRLTRPQEVPELMGDPSKIKKVLNWEPQIKIDELVTEMVDSVMKEEKCRL